MIDLRIFRSLPSGTIGPAVLVWNSHCRRSLLVSDVCRATRELAVSECLESVVDERLAGCEAGGSAIVDGQRVVDSYHATMIEVLASNTETVIRSNASLEVDELREDFGESGIVIGSEHHLADSH